MGLTYARVSLANPRRPELDPIEVDALAATGALHLCIPEHIAIQLLLDEQEKRRCWGQYPWRTWTSWFFRAHERWPSTPPARILQPLS